MYKILYTLFSFYATAYCGNYERYGDPSTRYPAYSTISSLYNQPYPYKGVSYGGDGTLYPPEATRYPNYNPSYTTPGYNGNNNNNYNTYNTNSRSPGSYGSYGYNTPRYGEGISSYEMPFMRSAGDYCVNRSPQSGIWVDSLMGMWYGVEVVEHLSGDSRVDYHKTCIVLHIAEPVEQPSSEKNPFHVQHIKQKFRHDYRHLRLLWDEAGLTTEYALYFRNDSAGYWQVADYQNGTMPSTRSYQQFTGTIQVLKAVNDHLVLNFCQEQTGARSAQLYSVLLSREPAVMARWEIEAVHSMLQNKKLSVASRRVVCGNGAVKVVTNLLFPALASLVAYVLCRFS